MDVSFLCDFFYIKFEMDVTTSKSKRNQLVNGRMRKKRKTNATFIVQFTCELNGIPLIWQFKPAISNQHYKNDQVDDGSEDRHRVEHFCHPNYQYILYIYSSFACTLNVHEIGRPEVAKGGSSSQFFVVVAVAAIHRHFTVVVVVVIIN